MSNDSETSLPPPIRDPITGKVYVAIPAPPFILPQDGSELDETQIVPGYVYVERKEVSANRLFTKDRSSTPVQRRSIGQWSSAAASSPPPPKHVPWEGSVTSASSSDSISAQQERASSRSANRDSCDQSISSIDLPSFESGFSLIRGRLPAVPSVVGSESTANIPVPKFAEVTARRTQSYTLSRRSHSSDSRHTDRPQACETLYPNHREAHVFRRRPELGSVEAPVQSTIVTPQFRPHKTRSFDRRLQDDLVRASPILEEGSTLDEETPKALANTAPIENPSLVVSTSNHSTLVSLDSTRIAKVSATKPLKIIKKSKVPAPLKLDIPKLGSTDYPDVPSPFCASPNKRRDRESYFIGGIYPRLHLDTKLSTEEMIESLLKQVENFKPRVPCTKTSPLDLGYTRLEDSNAEEGPHSKRTNQELIGLGLSLSNNKVADTTISSTVAESSLDNFSDSSGSIPTEDACTAPTSPIKSSISSGRSRSGTTSSNGSERRVRFNSGLNQRISAILLDKEETVSLLQISPPRSPASRMQKPKATTYSAATSPVTSPKRSTQTSGSPRKKSSLVRSPQQFRTMQHQKRSSKQRLSLVSAGLMGVKPVATEEGSKVQTSKTSAPSAIQPTPHAFSTLPRAIPNFTPSPLLPRRRMTDTLPSPSITTPKTFGLTTGAALVTPTPAPGANAGVSRRMALSSAPRMRSFTVGAARGKENREMIRFKENENKENEMQEKQNMKRVKASEALLAKRRHEVDENAMRRESEKGMKKALPFQGVLNRLKV